jgi:hypothetical protein
MYTCSFLTRHIPAAKAIHIAKAAPNTAAEE